MIDFSTLQLVPRTESDEAFGYAVKKAAEGAYIRAFWGRDEGVQEEWHRKDWEERRPFLIVYRELPIGTISVLSQNDHISVAHFFIEPDFQGRGMGTYLIEQILADADRGGKVVRLSVLKNNPARKLYERDGFRLVNTDDHFSTYGERTSTPSD